MGLPYSTTVSALNWGIGRGNSRRGPPYVGALGVGGHVGPPRQKTPVLRAILG